MKHWKLLIFFLVINFGGLAFGSWLMNNGPMTEWYNSLNKAPWTPPGWVFGFAWTTIMICFSLFLTKLFTINSSKKVAIIFIIQVLLNVSWNYLFFNQHLILLGLINLILLSFIVFYFYFKYSKETKNFKYLLLPYMIWLCIATSLNAYILLNN